jgi:hypothetical protein
VILHPPQYTQHTPNPRQLPSIWRRRKPQPAKRKFTTLLATLTSYSPHLCYRLYNDPTFSDVKIRQIYKGKVTEYAAHKAVLCAHSGWFMTALTGRFKMCDRCVLGSGAELII